MTQPPKKKAFEDSVNSVNSVENILNQKLSRRQALGRGAAIAIGAGVVVVGAAGYLAYVSTQGGTVSTTTQTSTVPPTTITATSTSTVAPSTVTLTSTTTASTSSTATSIVSGVYAYPPTWTKPSKVVKFDVWNFRPDLVQKSVDFYNLQYNENATVELISQNYFAVVETKLLNDDLDMSYNTPDGAAKQFAAGLTHEMDDITTDSPTGRILYNVSDIKTEINKDYPSFVESYTSLDGKYFGLPYYQSVLGALLANNKILSTAGLQPATGYDPAMWPQDYADLYSQVDMIQQKGAADSPFLPLWYQAFPGWGISQGFTAENVNTNGWKSLFTDAPDLKPTFDTNTSVADVLKNWKHLWDANQIPKDIITESQDGNVDGLFQSGAYAYAAWWLYNLWPFNVPTVSKIAGFAHPVPPTKNGWGYLVQQGILMRDEKKDPAYFERMKALLIYMAYKDRNGAYQNPLNIAAHAGIAAHTAFAAANTGPEVQDAWQAALPDSAKETPVMNDVLKAGAFNQVIRAHWGNDWMVALTDNLPKFLQGDVDLNGTITTLRKAADTLSVS